MISFGMGPVLSFDGVEVGEVMDFTPPQRQSIDVTHMGGPPMVSMEGPTEDLKISIRIPNGFTSPAFGDKIATRVTFCDPDEPEDDLTWSFDAIIHHWEPYTTEGVLYADMTLRITSDILIGPFSQSETASLLCRLPTIQELLQQVREIVEEDLEETNILERLQDIHNRLILEDEND